MSHEPIVWTCPTCASCRVQSQMWVRENTNKILDDTGRYHWCDACEEDGNDGEQKYLTERPLSETREAKLLAERQAQLLADDPAAPTQMEWECIELQELRAVLDEVIPKTTPDYLPALSRLTEAADALLRDACDRGEAFPDDPGDGNEYDHDKDGDSWHSDYFELNEAVEAARAAMAAPIVDCESEIANTPCNICQSTEVPLHTNGVCVECYKDIDRDLDRDQNGCA